MVRGLMAVRRASLILLLTVGTGLNAVAQTLEQLFRQPPMEARPLMIWQWMDGLVTQEGITADLEAYAQAGLGGVQQFNIGGTTQGLISDTTNAVGTENCKRLMGFAMQECQRLGLSFGTHNCPGWSSSAYPAVKPSESMQKLVWTETKASGSRLSVVLPRPEVDPQWNYYEDIVALALPDCDTVRLSDIQDVSGLMASDGRLTWQTAKGNYRLLRIGHTTNGKMNASTAPYGGVGLECDKMNREAVRKFWSYYPAMLLDIARHALGTDVGKTFQRIEIDSYEAGGQSWSVVLPAEFQKRCGYSVLPWLVTQVGIVVDSPERTKQFKKDYEDTVTSLFAENYYGYMGELAHETKGLRLLYQPYGTGGSKPFNPIDTWKIANQLKGDLICTEFWNKPERWGWPSVPRHMAVAHRLGLREVYAESFTCWPLHAWKDDPASLKPVADRAFCLGVNRLMLHAGAHNPWVKAVPGMTFGKWGTQFTPGQTWWRSGGARQFFDYLARCEALLQHGQWVDDHQSKSQSLSVTGGSLQWIHRSDGRADIYFLFNPHDSLLTFTVALADKGRHPELWHPDTGAMADAEAWQHANGQTRVALRLNAKESVFIVLQHDLATGDNGPGLQLPTWNTVNETAITGTWTLNFPDGWGAPAQVELDSLMAWDKHADEGVRYFSGTARYTIDFRQKRLDKQSRYVLDLGDVKNLARVTLNGTEVAHLWKPPFCVDVTNALRKGRNTLTVDVTNLWPNRMIGDEQQPDDVEWADPYQYDYAPDKPVVGQFMLSVPQWLAAGSERPVTARKTVVSFKYFKKDSPLMPSGLLGPVVIRQLHGQ